MPGLDAMPRRPDDPPLAVGHAVGDNEATKQDFAGLAVHARPPMGHRRAEEQRRALEINMHVVDRDAEAIGQSLPHTLDMRIAGIGRRRPGDRDAIGLAPRYVAMHDLRHLGDGIEARRGRRHRQQHREVKRLRAEHREQQHREDAQEQWQSMIRRALRHAGVTLGTNR